MNRFNKKYLIIHELILIIIFAFASICFCGRTVNAEGGQNADAGEAVPNPYIFNYFTDIYKDGQFIINGEVSCTVQDSGGLVISGDRQSFNAASFEIEKLFDFGTGSRLILLRILMWNFIRKALRSHLPGKSYILRKHRKKIFIKLLEQYLFL